MLIHVVKAGESLWRIANTYRVSMASIIDVNELTDPSRLVIGQALVIPEVREESVHTVKAGESLWRIAQTYGTTVQNITQANNITNPNLIYPGQRLTIPGKQKPSIAVNGFCRRACCPRLYIQSGDLDPGHQQNPNPHSNLLLQSFGC